MPRARSARGRPSAPRAAARGGAARAAAASVPVVAPDAEPLRTIVLWSPDWPITATRRSLGHSADAALALVDRNAVFACSAAARAEGVRRGMRVRDAQARCPGLVVEPYDSALDARAFEPVLAAIEALTPGVQVLRPGTVALRSRGPARYYGSERAAALALAGVLDDLGIPDTRVGIADGPFSAEIAARSSTIVPLGGSPAFLAPLPVTLIGDPALVDLLRRLGVLTLGAFAALEADHVRERFGDPAAWLHRQAGGGDARSLAPRTPPPELDVRVDFEPPLDRIDQIAFAVRAPAERFVDALVAERLVCTVLRIEVDAIEGGLSERSWAHPRSFSPADVVDRVRWQLQGAAEVDAGLGSAVVRVRLVPESVDAIGHHEQGLWGGGPDERVHHGLTRVQSMLGHAAVVQPVVAGGRTLADRTVLVPWGDAAVGVRDDRSPWPGRLPSPAPSTVFASPHPIAVLDARDAVVEVDERGAVSAPPARMTTGASLRGIVSWAGPWTADERWWDAAAHRRAHRFQLVDDTGAAWLAVLGETGWVLEARYD